MSTIIDALKRSDRERQINTTHTMSYSHLHEESSQAKAWTKYLVIAVVITAACIFAIMSFFNKQEAESNPIKITPSPIAQVNRKPLQNSSPQLVSPTVEMTAIESLKTAELKTQEPLKQNTALASIVVAEIESETLGVIDDSRTSLSDIVIIPASVNTSVESTIVPKVIEATAPQPKQESVNQSNDFIGYDNYASIRVSQNLPELHLDILMYHPISSQRKAFINMQAYKQGEQTSEGTELLKIGKKGVLLRYQGKDFVLNTN